MKYWKWPTESWWLVVTWALRFLRRIPGIQRLLIKKCILAKKPVYENNSSRISVCFEAHHASGTLYNVLSHMIYNGLNMTKIESRPIPGKTWEYRFFVDFEGNLRDSAVKNALRGMEAETSYLKILG